MVSAQPIFLFFFSKEGNERKDFEIFESFSKQIQKIGCVAAMILVKKSSKSELSSRFFGRLKIFGSFIFVGGVLEVVSPVLVRLKQTRNHPAGNGGLGSGGLA